MNKATFEKIRSATPFLLWFRCHLPGHVQTLIRCHLDQPQKLALNVLDCCSSTTPKNLEEIAQQIGVTRGTVRQVLLALKDGGMPFMISPTQQWQAVRDRDTLAASLTSLTPSLESQEVSSDASLLSRGKS